jgi:ATP-dependent Clp protease protease subunit
MFPDDDADPLGRLRAGLERQALETRTVLAFGELTPALAHSVAQQLVLLAARSAEPIRLLVNAHGGQAESGQALFDLIQSLSPRIETIATGAVSEAGLLAFLGAPRLWRYCLPHARFRLRAPAYAATGGDLAAEAGQAARQRQRFAEILAGQTGQPLARALADLERGPWLEAGEAAAYGLVAQVMASARPPGAHP